MTPFEIVLAALESHRCQPKVRGQHASAHCPAHDDRRASLEVGVSQDGVVLMHCFAHCDTKAVVAVIGLEMSDLFPASPPPRLTGRHPGSATERKRAGPQDDNYGIMPRGLIETAADPYCVQLYGYFDAVQGDGRLGFRAHGDQFIADTLGWGKSQTVRDHALHLAASGWVAIHKADTPSGAHKTTSYEVIHNPRRGRINENATTPIRKVRARPASRVNDLINNPKGSRRRTSKARQSTNGVVRRTHEVANNVERKKGDVLGTQIGSQKKNTAISCDLDPDGDVTDASEEILVRAPLTEAPPTDEATLERLFAEDLSEDLDWLSLSAQSGTSVGMTEDEAVAAVMGVFPGAELISP